jgi:putative addiction module component (TIGR02574 family)
VSTSVDKLVSEALELPAEVRAFVAEKLLESLDVEADAQLSDAWRKELRRRCREVDEGSVQLRDAGEAFAKARAALE